MRRRQRSDAAPGERLRFLFIHHSVGGQLLAERGPESGESSIHATHPNGGGLRARLAEAGYEVGEASYDSRIGQHTDLRDWLSKFRDDMARVLTTRHQDERHPDGEHNDIVAFKSCYPNNQFEGVGDGSGDAAVPELTVANAKAALAAFLPHLQSHPEVLFVYLTAPPLAPGLPPDPAWKWLAKRALGRGMTPERLRESARLARAFDDWVKSPDGWLAGYEGTNLAVFDYYDVLTGGGQSNLLAYPTGGGLDSHPSSEGQARAADAFLPFLARAVREAGLLE